MDGKMLALSDGAASAVRATAPVAGRAKPLTLVHAITDKNLLPELPPALISGLLRAGGKLEISGASKTGKSYLAIELACAVATGGRWCGFECAKGKVLYVNLEIRGPQFQHRVFAVVEKIECDTQAIDENLLIANMRGEAKDINNLKERLFATIRPSEYDLIIIDPVYKVHKGSENDADSVGRFCDALDEIAEGARCSVAYVHHHSKGAQGGKNAMDRASGSGVFARDVDALVDMIELKIDASAYNAEKLAGRGGIPYLLEFVARDFEAPDPRIVWFRPPIHEVDETEALAEYKTRNPGGRSGFNESENERRRLEIENRLDEFMGEKTEIDRKSFANATGIDDRTINKYLQNSTRFAVESGSNYSKIRRKEPIC